MIKSTSNDGLISYKSVFMGCIGIIGWEIDVYGLLLEF